MRLAVVLLAHVALVGCTRVAHQSPEAPSPRTAVAPPAERPAGVAENLTQGESSALLAAVAGEVTRVELPNGLMGHRGVVDPARWRESVDAVQRSLPPGWLAFATLDPSATADATRPPAAGVAHVTVVPAADPLDVVRAVGPEGPGRSTDDIVVTLATWDFAFGLVVKGVGPHWIAVKPLQRPGDWLALAEEAAALCGPATGEGLEARALAFERDDLISCYLD